MKKVSEGNPFHEALPAMGDFKQEDVPESAVNQEEASDYDVVVEIGDGVCNAVVSTNRTERVASSLNEDEPKTPTPTPGAGSYRLVHPATSDVIETPPIVRVDKIPINRLVIGVTKKP
jgi:hypothetical protein